MNTSIELSFFQATKAPLAVLKGSEESILINDEKKTFSKQSTKSKGNDDSYTVEKTSETTQVLGYTCVKYIVKGIDKRSGTKTNTFLWTTTDVAGIDYSPSLVFSPTNKFSLQVENTCKGRATKAPLARNFVPC